MNKGISIKVSFFKKKLNYYGVDAAEQLGKKINAVCAGVNKGDTVEWNGGKYAFFIDFAQSSPFAKANYHSKKETHTITATVKDDLQDGIYKYSITVYKDKGGKRWTDDPVLIVPPVK
ncbi:MAG: hypothetical protein WBC20_11550 [Candidatus Aminicenantaceae bacterium]